MSAMKPDKTSTIPPEVMADLEQAIRDAIEGKRDPERMRAAAERMDRMREQAANAMKPDEVAMPSEPMAELEQAIREAMRGRRDPGQMRAAAERMDRMREETYRKHGLLDIGLPAIRELRD